MSRKSFCTNGTLSKNSNKTNSTTTNHKGFDATLKLVFDFVYVRHHRICLNSSLRLTLTSSKILTCFIISTINQNVVNNSNGFLLNVASALVWLAVLRTLFNVPLVIFFSFNKHIVIIRNNVLLWKPFRIFSHPFFFIVTWYLQLIDHMQQSLFCCQWLLEPVWFFTQRFRKL